MSAIRSADFNNLEVHEFTFNQTEYWIALYISLECRALSLCKEKTMIIITSQSIKSGSDNQ